MQKKKSIAKKILLWAIGVLIVMAIAAWIFFTYYFQDFVNDRITAKLQEATRTATHGLFRLIVGKLKYSDGSFYCTKIEIVRARYDSAESGLTVKSLSADSVYFKGLHIFDILRGKGLFMERMETNAPQLIFTDADAGRQELKKFPPDTTPVATSMPKGLPVIYYDSIILTNIYLRIPKQNKPAGIDTFYDGVSIRLNGLRLDDTVLKAQPVFFCKGIDLAMKSFPYNLADSSYVLDIARMHASLTDSLITIDSFKFRSKYREDEFAAKHKYATPMADFHCEGIRFEGINFANSISEGAIEFRKFSVHSFFLDSYEDRRRPADPHPGDVMFPNELISSFPAKIAVDSVVLDNGKIRLRERYGAGPGSLDFDRVRIVVSPILKDTIKAHFKKKAMISLRALFLDQALLDATFTYPLDRKKFDMDVHATLGSFDAKRLNPWLIPIERIEVEDGTLTSGKIDMTVRNGKTQTSVLPLYHDFAIKILPKDPHQQRGFSEKLQTFFAGTFIIRGNNPNGLGSQKTGITTRDRLRDDEFFQFLWLAIRKSLGQVVGGFQ
jgi:hypothetical protein